MLNSDSPQPPKFLPLNITIYTILKRHSVMRMSKMGGSNGHTSDVTSEDTGDVKDQDSKRLEFSEDEENLISRMFGLVGERWSLIAGRIPGRTAEEIEKYWTSKGKCSSSRER